MAFWHGRVQKKSKKGGLRQKVMQSLSYIWFRKKSILYLSQKNCKSCKKYVKRHQSYKNSLPQLHLISNCKYISFVFQYAGANIFLLFSSLAYGLAPALALLESVLAHIVVFCILKIEAAMEVDFSTEFNNISTVFRASAGVELLGWEHLLLVMDWACFRG